MFFNVLIILSLGPLGLLSKKCVRQVLPRRTAMLNGEKVHPSRLLYIAPLVALLGLSSLALRNSSWAPFLAGLGFAAMGWRISCIGLTGGIATGKSTACSYIQSRLKCKVVDADAIAREVVAKDTPGFKAVVKEFGSQVVDTTTGDLDRAILGRIVFADRSAKARLERITHPRIVREMLKQVIFNRLLGRTVVMDVPLLFESQNRLGLSLICHETVLIDVPKEVQMRRLLERNPDLTPELAENRINSQLSREEKRSLADYIISNDGPVDHLQRELTRFFHS